MDFNLHTHVVDKTGKPLLMYHGGSYTGGEFRGTIWFTSSEVDAKYYAEQMGGVVTTAFLQIKNPLYVGDVSWLKMKPTVHIIDSAKKRNINLTIESGFITFIEPNGGVLIAQDIGRDGVIDKGTDGILDAVVFKDSQIINRNQLTEEFIKSEMSLTDKLLSIGGESVKLGLDSSEELDLMINSGQIFTNPTMVGVGNFGDCHKRVADLYRKHKSKGFKIVSGYALVNDVWYQHSWGLSGSDSVIETTSNKYDIYYGYILSSDDSEDFCFYNY
jgi:hypothetical protein